MSTKKTTAKKTVKKPAAKNEPKPGTWAALVRAAAYAKKAGLQNWPG